MSFWKKALGVVTNPIRGLGRIARGHVEEGLGDIAGSAKILAPLTGVGALGTLGISLADRAFNDKPITVGSTLKDAVGAYGSKFLGDSLLRHGGSAAGVGQPAGMPASMKAVARAVAPEPSGVASRIGRAVTDRLGNPFEGMSTAEKWSTGLDAAGKLGSAYGAWEEGRAEDEEIERRRARGRAFDPVRARLLKELIG